MPRASQFLKAGSAKFKSRCVGWCKHMLEFIKQVVMDAHTHARACAHTHTHTCTHARMHARTGHGLDGRRGWTHPQARLKR